MQLYLIVFIFNRYMTGLVMYISIHLAFAKNNAPILVFWGA